MSTIKHDLSTLPTLKTSAVHLSEDTQLLPIPILPFVVSPTVADCGHETRCSRLHTGVSFCPVCWLHAYCRACDAPVAVEDLRGNRWCEYHKRAAIFMNIGAWLGFPALSLKPVSLDDRIMQGQESWLFFAKATVERHPDVLRRACWCALELKLKVVIVEDSQEGEGR